MKTCNKCKTEKEYSGFSKSKSSKDGFNNICKKCISIRNKRYNINPDIKKRRSLYNKKYNATPEIKEKVLAQKKEYMSNPLSKDKRNESRRKRFKEDPLYKIEMSLRARTRFAIKDGLGRRKEDIIEVIGCTHKQVVEHLKSTLYGNMTWNDFVNGDNIHIDHIIPLSMFDLTTPEGQKESCYYTNLQLLWDKDNIEKRNKLDWKHPTNKAHKYSGERSERD